MAVVLVFVSECAAWIWSFITTRTPLSFAFGSAATATALYRFKGPSALTAVDGRIEPTSTTGLSLFTVKLRKYAVSSIVSVPCVTTMPSTAGVESSSLARLASFSMISNDMSFDPTFEICYTWKCLQHGFTLHSSGGIGGLCAVRGGVCNCTACCKNYDVLLVLTP